MAAALDAVVDQPQQDPFARRLVTIKNVFANRAVPPPEALDSLFNHAAIRALVSRGALWSLIVHMVSAFRDKRRIHADARAFD